MENRIRASERNLGDSQLYEMRLHTRVGESTPVVASTFSNWTGGPLRGILREAEEAQAAGAGRALALT